METLFNQYSSEEVTLSFDENNNAILLLPTGEEYTYTELPEEFEFSDGVVSPLDLAEDLLDEVETAAGPAGSSELVGVNLNGYGDGNFTGNGDGVALRSFLDFPNQAAFNQAFLDAIDNIDNFIPVRPEIERSIINDEPEDVSVEDTEVGPTEPTPEPPVVQPEVIEDTYVPPSDPDEPVIDIVVQPEPEVPIVVEPEDPQPEPPIDEEEPPVIDEVDDELAIVDFNVLTNDTNGNFNMPLHLFDEEILEVSGDKVHLSNGKIQVHKTTDTFTYKTEDTEGTITVVRQDDGREKGYNLLIVEDGHDFDFIVGSDGHDLIFATDSDEVISGGHDNAMDIIHAGGGFDTVYSLSRDVLHDAEDVIAI